MGLSPPSPSSFTLIHRPHLTSSSSTSPSPLLLFSLHTALLRLHLYTLPRLIEGLRLCGLHFFHTSVTALHPIHPAYLVYTSPRIRLIPPSHFDYITSLNGYTCFPCFRGTIPHRKFMLMSWQHSFKIIFRLRCPLPLFPWYSPYKDIR